MRVIVASHAGTLPRAGSNWPAVPDDGARQGVDGAPVAVVQLAQGALVAGGHALNEWPVHGLESGGDSQAPQTVRCKRRNGLEG